MPTSDILRRIDRLAGLGAGIITLSGGEPLLHPELDGIIRHIRKLGMIATLITNGYLLTPDRILRLNRAGLDQLQVSIDNILPDDASKKSLKVLDRKLVWLAKHAEFDVNINTVLGASIQTPEDALVIARRARQLGFSSTVGILHDHSGQLQPLSQRHRAVYEQIVDLSKSFFSYVQNNRFQRNLVRGLPNEWHCPAGARYLYVCEDGLVHWCSQQRGYPGIPLDQYTHEDLARQYVITKSCAPYCTISCVHQTAIIDDIRKKPHETLVQLISARHDADAPFELPVSLKALSWLLLDSSARPTIGKIALRILGARTQ